MLDFGSGSDSVRFCSVLFVWALIGYDRIGSDRIYWLGRLNKIIRRVDVAGGRSITQAELSVYSSVRPSVRLAPSNTTTAFVAAHLLRLVQFGRICSLSAAAIVFKSSGARKLKGRQPASLAEQTSSVNCRPRRVILRTSGQRTADSGQPTSESPPPPGGAEYLGGR